MLTIDIKTLSVIFSYTCILFGVLYSKGMPNHTLFKHDFDNDK